MDKRVLKEFIQCLQNRVAVAASLSVIKCKPKNVTGEQYAGSIQQLVYDNWVKDNSVSCFENKIIELQYKKLFKEINELLGAKGHNDLMRHKRNLDLLLTPKKEGNLFLSILDKSFVGDNFEDNKLDGLVPNVHLKDNLGEAFPCVSSGGDTQNELFYDFCSEEEEQDELIPGVCSEEYRFDELNIADSDFDENDLFEHNVSFIQAIVHLKFPFFSNDCLTVDIIHNLLDKFANENLHKYSLNNIISIPDGSGFGGFSAYNYGGLNVDQIRIIINSSRTEFLFKKCLTSVIHFANKNIHNNSNAIFYTWHGSLMEYLCSVLEDISFHPVCTDYLSKIILKNLDDIWSSEDSCKHFLWEHQHHILSVFCMNSHVCESVIGFIIAKFDVLIDLLRKIQIGTFEHLVCIHLIEKLPHFSRFLCMVIKKLQYYKVGDIYHKKNKIQLKKSIKVTDLWKLKWRESDGSELSYENKLFQGLLNRWKETCEKLIIISAENFPLISFHIWDIMKILQDWDVEI